MNTARTSPGLFTVVQHDGSAWLNFVPHGHGVMDTTIPGLSATDLRAIGDMALAEADEMDPPGPGEQVTVRITGGMRSVAMLTTWLARAHGVVTSELEIINRTGETTQGYMTVSVPGPRDGQ